MLFYMPRSNGDSTGDVHPAMKVVLLSPGYPADMPEFTRGLAQSGAQVLGVGDQPGGSLPERVGRYLWNYLPRLGGRRSSGAASTRRSIAATTSQPSTSGRAARRRITRIDGIDALQKRFGRHVVWNTLLRPGTPRRDWKKTFISDGFIMLRHPELDETLQIADAVGSDLHLYAE